MKSKQFQEVDLVCPNCGYVIGKQAYFQYFEVKVAGWLKGIVAPPATPTYDVLNCKSFPDLTFQVKYSTAYRFHAKGKKYAYVVWDWIVKKPHPIKPDFFVLFGIGEQSEEYVFLMSRNEFYSHATEYKGTYKFRTSAKLKSDRKNGYVALIWKHLVKNPEVELENRILDYPIQDALSVELDYFNQ